MSDIVWTNKSLNDNFEQLMVRMREFTARLLESKGIEYEFSFDDSLKNIKWNAQKYYDFYMIFKEAINNAVKYSEANHLIINTSKEKQELILRIEDNGKGFNQNQTKSGKRHYKYEKRTEQLKGIFNFETEIGKEQKLKLRFQFS